MRLPILLGFLLFPATSRAQAPWHRLTEPTLRNIDEVTLARTPDGVLHAAWLRKAGTKWDLVHATVDSAGTAIGNPVAIVSGWNSLNNPYLLVEPGGSLRVLLSGIRGRQAGDTYAGAIYTATAEREGDSWTLARGGVSKAMNTSAPGATLTRDGKALVSWSGGPGLFFHQGLSDHDPDQKVSAVTTCCAYNTALATDGETGAVVLAWFSNATNQEGSWAQTVAPAMGPVIFAPNSGKADHSAAVQISQRIALSARTGGPGVYLAYCSGYPTCQAINLWRQGSDQPMVVSEVRRSRHVGISPGPRGRLWVMWDDGIEVFATRTNMAATRFGPIVSSPAPAGTSNIWKVNGEGSRGPLDLIASVTTAQGIAMWQRRLLPVLSLSVSRADVPVNDTLGVVFQVTDAGDPVPGASVTVGNQSGSTDQNGRWRVLPPVSAAAVLTARATMPGYQDASVRVRVVRRP